MELGPVLGTNIIPLAFAGCLIAFVFKKESGAAVLRFVSNAIKHRVTAITIAGVAFVAINAGTTLAQTHEAGAPHLVFNWVETGVSLVADEAGRGGFGTELITQALPYRLGAETSFEVRSGGVRCLLDVPMPAAQDRTGEAVGV